VEENTSRSITAQAAPKKGVTVRRLLHGLVRRGTTGGDLVGLLNHVADGAAQRSAAVSRKGALDAIGLTELLTSAGATTGIDSAVFAKAGDIVLSDEGHVGGSFTAEAKARTDAVAALVAAPKQAVLPLIAHVVGGMR